MDFNLFMYCTIGRRAELEAGMAGHNPELYQRMLAEIAEYAGFADKAGFGGFGHPEHHLQIEGFEIANDPTLMSMWLGQHTERLKVITCGFVSTAHNPLRTAEAIATMDHMLGGRFGVGIVRGYQARWVDNFRIRPDLQAVGPWNKNSEQDTLNREYFEEFVEIVVTALKNETFSHHGKFWDFPPKDFVNPHPHSVYSDYGRGVAPDMKVSEIGIAPRPLQRPHPQLYGGFTASMTTAKFWARYAGRPIVLAEDLDFCRTIWSVYRDEAATHGHDIAAGDEAGWGGLMICCETDAEAEAWFEDMNWFWEKWPIQFGQGLPKLLVGSPDTISREIEAAAKAVPINECFLLIPQGLHTREQVMSSLELFSEKVMPQFSNGAG
jgi:alkanesulfonate monooxygenase SsuD/methylene tetrahydromethanopterin reductase-like flavin-dependent oxidoreductase (luciferase family)